MSAPFGCFNPHTVVGRRPPRYDAAELLPKFETREDVQRRSEILARWLKKSNAANARGLAERLASCGETIEGHRRWCLSSACLRCTREMRRWQTNEAVTLAQICRFVGEPYGVIVTVVPSGLTAPLGFLSGISLQKVQRRFWKAMDRLKIQGHPIIGGIDVSHNLVSGSKDPGYFQVHLAFAIFGYPDSEADRKKLKELVKEAFRVEPTAPRPVVVKPIRNPVRQLSYLLKSTFYRRISYIGDNGRWNTRKPAPVVRASEQVEIARWLDKYSMTDRLLLYGVRREGDRLRVTSKSVSRD